MARQSSCFPEMLQCQARPAATWGLCRRQRNSSRGAGARGVVYASASASPGERPGGTVGRGTPATHGASQGLARGRPSGRPAWRGVSRPCALRSTRPGPRRPAGRVSRHESWPRTAAQPHPACPACVLGCKHTTRFLLRVAVRGKEACWWTLHPQRTRCLTQCFLVSPPQSPAKRAWR